MDSGAIACELDGVDRRQIGEGGAGRCCAPVRALDHAVENEAFARYGKTGGWRFTFRTQLNEATRNDGVVATIALGMRVGYSWVLSGDVFHDA